MSLKRGLYFSPETPIKKTCVREIDITQEYYEYLTDNEEVLFKSKTDFLNDSKNYENSKQIIKEYYRQILIDWLVKVCLKFDMDNTTLFLCVDIIDRSLDKLIIKRDNLQLLGCVALLLAAKFLQVRVPYVQALIDISDNAFTKKQFIEMERKVFEQGLCFKMNGLTSNMFLPWFFKNANSSKKEELLTNYIIELTAMEYSFVNVKPSLIASSCLYLARQYTMPKEIWNYKLQTITRYKSEDLKFYVIKLHVMMLGVWDNHNETIAIREKYDTKKFQNISTIVCMKTDDLCFHFV